MTESGEFLKAKHREFETFGSAVAKVADPIFTPVRSQDDKKIAENYCNWLIKMIDKNHIMTLRELVADSNNLQVSSNMTIWFTKIATICSSIQITEEILFYHSFKGYASIHNAKMDEMLDVAPAELKVILAPF